MIRRSLILSAISASLWGQVRFDRILNADKEPQNWLTYSGNLKGQRHSGLKQISPANVKNLELQWVWQAKSLEAELIQVTYRRAVCGFLDGRLVNIDYRFGRQLSTAAELLSASGFPESAAAVDDGHLPFRAMLTPFGNPIRYHGLVYTSVLFGEDLKEITVAIANVNDHFSDWPDGNRKAWLEAGGVDLSLSLLDRPFRPKTKEADTQ